MLVGKMTPFPFWFPQPLNFRSVAFGTRWAPTSYKCILITPGKPIWVFPKIVVPQNGWFIMEIPIKMDDLAGKPTIFGNTHLAAKMTAHLVVQVQIHQSGPHVFTATVGRKPTQAAVGRKRRDGVFKKYMIIDK